MRDHQEDKRAPAAATDPAEVTGYADPEGEAPWAMPLVARVEKTNRPTQTAVCEAAARAVVLLLTDQRAQPGGEWEPAVTRWMDGRIRKVVRRARGAKWTEVQTLPGITVVHRGAEVRAYVPGSTAAVPAALSKLQVAGLDLDDTGLTAETSDARFAAAGRVLRLALNPHVSLSTGKAAAQCGHAAQLAAAALGPDELSSWVASGAPLFLMDPSPAEWRSLEQTAPVKVTDAGFTEIPAGTDTALAWW